jgi:hypothetical protein
VPTTEGGIQESSSGEQQAVSSRRKESQKERRLSKPLALAAVPTRDVVGFPPCFRGTRKANHVELSVKRQTKRFLLVLRQKESRQRFERWT